jgi:hypothetical protein
MTLRLNVAQAREIEALLSTAISSGVDYQELSQREFNGLESSYIDMSDTKEAELNESLWNQSMNLRNRLLDQGEVQKYRAQDSDAFGIALEELMSSELHRIINHLPSERLHDAGFWRYLALFPFRWYLIEREAPLQAQDYGGTETNRDKWLLIRTFQWGRKCYQPGEIPPYTDATAARRVKRELGVTVGYVIDFYHSHIVRHRWADNSQIAHEFISACSREPYVNDFSQERREVNEFSKRVNRVVSNLSLLTMSSEEVKGVMEGEKKAVLEH